MKKSILLAGEAIEFATLRENICSRVNNDNIQPCNASSSQWLYIYLMELSKYRRQYAYEVLEELTGLNFSKMSYGKLKGPIAVNLSGDLEWVHVHGIEYCTDSTLHRIWTFDGNNMEYWYNKDSPWHIPEGSKVMEIEILYDGWQYDA